jgi:hypothetical protein
MQAPFSERTRSVFGDLTNKPLVGRKLDFSECESSQDSNNSQKENQQPNVYEISLNSSASEMSSNVSWTSNSSSIPENEIICTCDYCEELEYECTCADVEDELDLSDIQPENESMINYYVVSPDVSITEIEQLTLD